MLCKSIAFKTEMILILFQTIKGFEDIQEHALSIENPVVRTYVGFNSIKN